MKQKLIWAGLIAFSMYISPTGTAAQEPAIPDTPPGKLFKEWLAFCNGPQNIEAWTKWNSANNSPQVLQHMSAEEITRTDAQECVQQGGYRLERITESSPERISTIVVGNKTHLWQRLGVAVENGKIRGFGGGPEDMPESSVPKDVSDSGIKKEVEAAVAKLAPAGLASGIVYAARGTQPIFSVTAGYADQAKKSPFTANSQFTLGSMGKMFTAAAIGQLVDQGKLSYDDTVGKFFPEYRNKTVRDKVTVGMLLSHTGGLGDFLMKRTPEMMKNGTKRASEFVPLFDNDEPKFEPGTSWAYSNAGLSLAGAIVEKVSGENYADYIRKHIFEPAGMKDSDPNNIPHAGSRMVTPYTHRTPEGPSDQWVEAEHDIGSPAGGAISTAADLVRFAEALRNGKLVSKATFAQMTSTHGKTPWGGQYGYAMEIDDLYGQKIVGHGGGFPGVNTHLYIYLGSPYTLVTLSNQDPPAADNAAQLAKALLAEKAKQAK